MHTTKGNKEIESISSSDCPGKGVAKEEGLQWHNPEQANAKERLWTPDVELLACEFLSTLCIEASLMILFIIVLLVCLNTQLMLMKEFWGSELYGRDWEYPARSCYTHWVREINFRARQTGSGGKVMGDQQEQTEANQEVKQFCIPVVFLCIRSGTVWWAIYKSHAV